MSDEFNPVAFGRMSEKVEGLDARLERIESKLDSVVLTIERQRGAKWAFGTVIALISGGATSAIHQLFGIGK